MWDVYAVYKNKDNDWEASIAKGRPNVPGFSCDYLIYARTPQEAIRKLFKQKGFEYESDS